MVPFVTLRRSPVIARRAVRRAACASVPEVATILAAQAGFMFSEPTVRKAIASRRMFQFLDLDLVIKLDLYPRCLIPGELDRSVRAEIFPGVVLPLVARTDAALSKLIGIAHGSDRSRRDLRRILAGASTDEVATVRRIAADMNLVRLLDDVFGERDEIDP